MQRLLSFYQYWLDDLYPKANFADGLSMVEKLGHKRQIRMMRQMWIDEGKPKVTAEHEPDTEFNRTQGRATDQNADALGRLPARDDPTLEEDARRMAEFLMPELRNREKAPAPSDQNGVRHDEVVEEPADDELDILLAEAETSNDTAPTSLFGGGGQPQSREKASGDQEADFAEDMEAMAEFGDVW
jgi:replication fork protection complex subunit Csm3/Swi3